MKMTESEAVLLATLLANMAGDTNLPEYQLMVKLGNHLEKAGIKFKKRALNSMYIGSKVY